MIRGWLGVPAIAWAALSVVLMVLGAIGLQELMRRRDRVC